MNVSQVQSPIATPETSTVDTKRAVLQAALLKKSLDSQNEMANQISQEAEGKGRLIDLRV